MPFHTTRVSLPLSAKLLFGFLWVTIPSLALMAAINSYALWNLTSVNDQLREISRSLEAEQSLETAVARTVTPLSAYLVDRTAGEYQRYEASMQEVEVRLKSCGVATCHETSQKRRAMAESLVPYIREIKDYASIIFGAGESLTDQDKIRVLHEIKQHGEDVQPDSRHQRRHCPTAIIFKQFY